MGGRGSVGESEEGEEGGGGGRHARVVSFILATQMYNRWDLNPTRCS